MQNGSAKKFNGTYLLVSEDSHEYRCCCGCFHVKYGAVVIGVLNVVIAVLVLTFVALSRTIVGYVGDVNAGHVIVMAAVTVIVTTSVILMIFGIRLRRATLILPFMAVQIVCLIGLVVWIIYAVALILLLGASTKTSTPVESTVIDQKYNISNTKYGLRLKREDDNDDELTGTERQRKTDRVVEARGSSASSTANPSKDSWGMLPTFLLITANVIYLAFGATLLTWFLVTAYKCYRYLRVKDKFTVHHLPPAYYGSACLK